MRARSSHGTAGRNCHASQRGDSGPLASPWMSDVTSTLGNAKGRSSPLSRQPPRGRPHTAEGKGHGAEGRLRGRRLPTQVTKFPFDQPLSEGSARRREPGVGTGLVTQRRSHWSLSLLPPSSGCSKWKRTHVEFPGKPQRTPGPRPDVCTPNRGALVQAARGACSVFPKSCAYVQR